MQEDLIIGLELAAMTLLVQTTGQQSQLLSSQPIDCRLRDGNSSQSAFGHVESWSHHTEGILLQSTFAC